PLSSIINVINMKEKEYYKAKDLADKLDVNIMTIYRYIKAGKLKAYKIGKEFRIEKKEFINFLNRTKIK
ncbi:MAG: helix-turn-helix domain-containing protein, partial [Candidatus Pacebacteria bacterium]|nr:helix-turn-helix domain-containing protein [Candidatus Paceibacterota bacterium]